MVLNFRREAAKSHPEALVFADGFTYMDALTDDLDQEFGVDSWESVANADAMEVLDTVSLETAFAIFAVSTDVPQSIEGSAALIRKARAANLTILLIVGDISSRSMHRLIREGVAEFAPYPDLEGSLPEAVSRLRIARTNNLLPGQPGGGAVRHGQVITIYGAAGGVGASTMAVNLAWEIARATRKKGRKVALLDFNFQFGAIATYLDVPRREAVYELVSEAASLDQASLTQALSSFRDTLQVLTAPRDALPLDIVSPNDITAIINHARESFDYVLIDMPQSLMNWSEQVYIAADQFYAVMEIDMRSAQNMFRFLRTLKAENMELDKIRFVLNRAPGLTDLSGKARVKRVAESLGITFSYLMPDGGRQVVNACDQGVPLAETAKSNPLRKEIVKIAQQILANDAVEAASR